jgi:hypothetical protein
MNDPPTSGGDTHFQVGVAGATVRSGKPFQRFILGSPKLLKQFSRGHAPNTSMNRGVNESRITMREPGASLNHTLRHGGKDTIFK